MRFLADMGVSPKTVVHLVNLGHDAVHLHAQGLDRLPDTAILEKTRLEQRVLLTHDLDFGDLVAASHAKPPSIVILRLRNMRPECVNPFLEKVIAQFGDALEQGAIISVTEAQVRVRLLPLKPHE